jgi:hypothetical protein
VKGRALQEAVKKFLQQHFSKSLTTCSGKMDSAGRRLASLKLAQGLLELVLGLPAAALVGVVSMFLVWSCEQQARRHDMVEAKQVKKQAAEEISRLQGQAARALRDAHTSAEVARKLEAQRQQLAREAERLRQSLESLRQQELARANEVATLPTSEVASRVATRLQGQDPGFRIQDSGRTPEEQGIGNREQGTGQVSGVGGQVPGKDPGFRIQDSGRTPEEQGIGNREQGIGQVSGVGGQVPGKDSGFRIQDSGKAPVGQVSGFSAQASGPQPLNPLTRPAPAGESAGAGHPLPQGGEGEKSLAALALSDQEAREVETAFVALDSCRRQSQVMGQQVSNCEQQVKLDSAVQAQESATIAKLHTALADKDQVLARSEEAHRAELKAACGTWRAHFIRAAEIFAGGFIVGALVR